MKPTGRIFSQILLSLVSILLTLFICEIALRVVNFPKQSWSPWTDDAHTGFRYAPSVDQRMVTEEYDVSVKTNEFGFRDDTVQPKNGKRILLLGDSFTFGYGVDRPYIFADLIEKTINTDVVNAGTGGFDLIHEVQRLKYEAKKIEPDLVVYILYLGNDLVGNWKWKKVDENIEATHKPTVRSHFDIKLITLIKILRQRLVFKEHKTKWKLPNEYLALTEKNLSEAAQKDYQSSEILLKELAAEAKNQNLPLLVVLMPYQTMVNPALQTEISSDYDLGRPAKEVTKILDKAHIPVFDLTPKLKEAKTPEQLYFVKDGHLTPYGHEVVGELISEEIKTKFLS